MSGEGDESDPAAALAAEAAATSQAPPSTQSAQEAGSELYDRARSLLRSITVQSSPTPARQSALLLPDEHASVPGSSDGSPSSSSALRRIVSGEALTRLLDRVEGTLPPLSRDALRGVRRVCSATVVDPLTSFFSPFASRRLSEPVNSRPEEATSEMRDDERELEQDEDDDEEDGSLLASVRDAPARLAARVERIVDHFTLAPEGENDENEADGSSGSSTARGPSRSSSSSSATLLQRLGDKVIALADAALNGAGATGTHGSNTSSGRRHLRKLTPKETRRGMREVVRLAKDAAGHGSADALVLLGDLYLVSLLASLHMLVATASRTDMAVKDGSFDRCAQRDARSAVLPSRF